MRAPIKRAMLVIATTASLAVGVALAVPALSGSAVVASPAIVASPAVTLTPQQAEARQLQALESRYFMVTPPST